MSSDQKTALNHLESAVSQSDLSLLVESFEYVKDPAQALKALTRGLDASREKLGDYQSSVAEFLLCVDVMRHGLEKLKSLDPSPRNLPVVVIGVVQGDVHDLGKNIVTGVLEACGYKVVDLGRDVSPNQFVEAAEKHQASVLALSTMMSTPLADMAKTIELCKNKLPHVKILVGGAPLDAQVARDLGADGYADSAVGVPHALEDVTITINSQSKASRVFVDYDKRLRVEEIEAAPKAEQEKAD